MKKAFKKIFNVPQDYRINKHKKISVSTNM
jgi:hypothetical protein